MQNHAGKLRDSRLTAEPTAAVKPAKRIHECDSWDNEGGATPSAVPEPPRPPKRKREDTAEGCRAMASADHDRADAVSSDRMRSQLERSAQAWTDRADMFDHLDEKARTRHDAGNGATSD